MKTEIVYRDRMSDIKIGDIPHDRLVELFKENAKELIDLREENRCLDIQNFNLIARAAEGRANCREKYPKIKSNYWKLAFIIAMAGWAYTSIRLARERLHLDKLAGYMEYKEKHPLPKMWTYKRIKSDEPLPVEGK